MSVTVREIARVARVSPATVSRALTKPDSVAEQTRNRVLRVAEELGYQRLPEPVEAPRAATATVGVVVPDLLNPTSTAFVRAAQHRLHLRGHEMVMGDSGRDGATELDLVRSIVPQVDGLVISSALSGPALKEVVGDTPMLLIDAVLDGLPSLNIEYADGMQQAVGHLVSLGHRRIAYAGGRLATWAEAQRREGLRAAVESHDLPDFLDLGHYLASVGGGYAAADQMMSTGATAIVCVNTFLAMGLMFRLIQRGISVPADVSVLQFDAGGNSHLISPMLTTVAPPDGAAGTAAADEILRTMQGRGSGYTSVPVDLAIRQTTGVAPSAG